MLSITFVSNFLTIHQQPFCDALYRNKDVNIRFIATKPLSKGRRAMGWKESAPLPYEIRAYLDESSKKLAESTVRASDVVIFGNDEEDGLFRIFMTETKGIAFRCSERIYKNGRWRFLSPRGVLRRYRTYYKYSPNRLYLLCSSAYAAGDYALLLSYINKCYKWGYFPPIYNYNNTDDILSKKKENSFLWAGRFLKLKHPEVVFSLAKYMRKKGLPFEINMLGDGPLYEDIKEKVRKLGLSDCIHLLGNKSPSEVREYMCNSQFFLATSDYREGWGAVVNEAMNSGCVVIANKAMGSVPFLIKDGYNGLVYGKYGFSSIFDSIKSLMDNGEERKLMGKNAYETVVSQWNAEVAADRFVAVVKKLLNGERFYFDDGPCSRAKRI